MQEKGHPDGCPFGLTQLANLVELEGQCALLVSSSVLVQNALANSLIDFFHCDFECAIGLGAIAFCGSDLKLFDGSLQFRLRGSVSCVSNLTDEDTLLGRLNIWQTIHLLRQINTTNYSSVQNDILADFFQKSKPFLKKTFIFLKFVYIVLSSAKTNGNTQYLVKGGKV